MEAQHKMEVEPIIMLKIAGTDKNFSTHNLPTFVK